MNSIDSSVMWIQTWLANNFLDPPPTIFYVLFFHSLILPSIFIIGFRLLSLPRRGGWKIIWPLDFTKGREMGEMTTFCIFKPKQFLPSYLRRRRSRWVNKWSLRGTISFTVITYSVCILLPIRPGALSLTDCALGLFCSVCKFSNWDE